MFTCVGGVLYDRSGTRSISLYKGLTQVMPIFVILFFILCLGNSGAPLTLNFVGEFLSLFGVFQKLPYLGLLAGISIVLSAAYTIYLFNRTAFGGVFSKFFGENIRDISHRETIILFLLVLFTVILGIYPSIITDGLNYTLSTLIFEGGELSVCTLGILLKISRAQEALKKNYISKFNFYTIMGIISKPASFLNLISLNKVLIIDRDIVKNNLSLILSIIWLLMVYSFISYNILFNLKDIILIFAILIIFWIFVQERSSTILNFSINSIWILLNILILYFFLVTSIFIYGSANDLLFNLSLNICLNEAIKIASITLCYMLRTIFIINLIKLASNSNNLKQFGINLGWLLLSLCFLGFFSLIFSVVIASIIYTFFEGLTVQLPYTLNVDSSNSEGSNLQPYASQNNTNSLGGPEGGGQEDMNVNQSSYCNICKTIKKLEDRKTSDFVFDRGRNQFLKTGTEWDLERSQEDAILEARNKFNKFNDSKFAVRLDSSVDESDCKPLVKRLAKEGDMLTKTSSTKYPEKSKYIACSNTKIQLDVSIKALQKLDETEHNNN